MSIELTISFKTLMLSTIKNINYDPYIIKYRVIHWNTNNGPIFKTYKEAKKYANNYTLVSIHKEICIG